MTDKQTLQTIGLNLRRIAKMIFLGEPVNKINYFVDETKQYMGVNQPESLKKVFDLIPWNVLFAKKYSRNLADELCTYGSIISMRARDLKS
jgi:hypothetical protein